MFRKAIMILFLGAIAASGCKQTEGESCQIDNDCEAPLICCKSAGSDTPIDRGICLLESECNLVPDAVTDTSPDTAGDPGTDTQPDTADVPVDTAPDSPDDTTGDDGATPDTAGDGAADSAPDTPADDGDDADAPVG